jgi:hypothetical protein
MTSRHVGNRSRALMTVLLLGLGACTGLPEAYRGGPEPVALKEKPFNGFVTDEDKSARWLASDLLGTPDKLLADPPQALQAFSQLEWTSNELKRTYVQMSMTQLQNLLESRDSIRLAMNIPANQPVGDAIASYAQRSRNVSDADRRLFTERRDLLRVAMVNAGYALRRYTEAVDRTEWDFNQGR